MSPKLPEINLKLHRKQTIAIDSPATEIMYGGAAGGGKSHLMRAAFIIWCSSIPGLQVYLFRRVSKDLMSNHMEGPNGFRNLLSSWCLNGFCRIVENEIRFWNGSKIFLCHCQHEKNMYDYDGVEIHVLCIDELTHFTERIYRFLRGRVRAVGLGELPKEYQGKFPRIMCGTNPGNIGHLWVKKTFVDNCEPLEIREMSAEEGGMLRQYIPALLEDNPSMLKDDPTYEAKLQGLGSDALVKSKRYGIWDIVEGAYFDCWEKDKHVIRPFTIPKHWTRFRSFDWGSAKPFSVGWYAISDGYLTPDLTFYPVGAIIKYKEWYGCEEGKTDKGLKMTVEAVAKGIIERDNGDTIQYSVADPAIFAEDGGPSMSTRFALNGVYFSRADNSRIPGWDQMRQRLKGDGDGRPMLYFFSNCHDSIRTIPALQHDEKKPEDLDTNMEDHAADECRYGCMSHPWVTTEKKPEEVDRYSEYNEVHEDEEWRTI